MSTADSETLRISSEELAAFTRQLGAMQAAGVDVLRALRIASLHSGNARLMEVSQTVGHYLKDGREFHQSIARHPDVFDPFYVEMARQGEKDGTLGQALIAIADYLDHSTVRGAAPAVAPRSGTDTGVVAGVMATLGVLAVGAAGIWTVAAADLITDRWLYPLAAFWSGICLLAGAWLLRRLSLGGEAQPLPVPSISLPLKSAERKALETEAVVRSALDEQGEAIEAQGVGQTEPGKNGTAPVADPQLFFPDESPPKFDI